tara:strand:- start:602 stop:733 length:132 start_codon:yes stop_codon:yes gene_type:complete
MLSSYDKESKCAEIGFIKRAVNVAGLKWVKAVRESSWRALVTK